MRNAAFKVEPIAGALGAELHGCDLSAALSDETIDAIRQALLDHVVIFFRDQHLPPEQFLALARRFGTPIEYPFVKGIAVFPRSSTSPSWSMRQSTSAASGTPTRRICKSRRWRHCW
jgi:alpha-ketoglutarate-dependent taurine dioxygenase